MLLGSAAMLAALLLDRLLGEPSRHHPLVLFGNTAQWMELQLRRWATTDPAQESATKDSAAQASASQEIAAPANNHRLYIAGAISCLLLVGLPALVLSLLVSWLTPAIQFVLSVLVLYLCLGARSLTEHAQAVSNSLVIGDHDQARTALASIVSRDTDELDASGIAGATVETVLENGNDAVIASLFWFVLAGAPGALAHRLVNTLDAMWGYRNARYRCFGWASARLDDVMAWLPARCCALGYALTSGQFAVIRPGFKQARQWDSPNAGPVMAVGATSLGIVLGGPTRYGDEIKPRPTLGAGRPPAPADIDSALQLVRRTSLLFVAVIALVGLVI